MDIKGFAMEISVTHHENLAETLETLSRIHHYHRWIFDQFRETLGSFVLEIGSGIGNLTQLLLETPNRQVWATDVVPTFLDYLKRRFPDESRLHVRLHDACQVFMTEKGLPVDSVLCVNVLEHVENDAVALKAMYDSLAPGGFLNLLVPAIPSIYGTIDREIGHYRRYRKRELMDKLVSAGFRIEKLYGFNPVGIFGWWLQGRVLKRKTLSPGQTLLFDRLVPILRRLPFQSRAPIGISWIAIARRPS